MKIASYNIMSGGFDSYASNSETPERLPLLQKAIKQINADVIGLIDTFRWDEVYTESELAELFHYSYSYCINLNDERLQQLGHNNGIALLSNIEIEPSTISLGTRNAILTTIHTSARTFNLVIAYLDDLSEDARFEQIRSLRALINATDQLILMGDLNSISREDRLSTKKGIEKFSVDNPDIAQGLRPVIDDMLRAETIKQLGMWGLKDADIGQRRPTMPTPLFPAHIDDPFLRLDYCFHSPSLPISNFTVHYDDIFQEASDHFPISFVVK